MPEICTPPIIQLDENGEPTVTFTENHTLADIARWICRNQADREMMIHLLQRNDDTPGEKDKT
jgi:hypothetical protein